MDENSKELEEIREELTQALKNYIVKVTFMKKDGTKREMFCTLQEKYLPVIEEKEGEEKKERKPNLNVLNVWDTEKEGWRAFRVDSIVSAEKTML